ncbi:methyltransferase domain-containing protein [Arenibacter sp. N53]|uniref:arsenite methyltransferase n=1 Tax=Arenibacter TaxID=178469 RepID=UPI000CD45B71|nr:MULTISPECIES: arsenite methyltransferase [Arenibacter]MCM4151128.1 methyltransferase domain-containing protein [Arenibacter sp. N53]
MKTKEIKSAITKSYGDIATNNIISGCCNSAGCCTGENGSTSLSENYAKVKGYNKDADLLLGCGLPTEIANIKAGDTVIDLGSGAGNDVFIARSIVGDTGEVIGVDMTPEMVVRAIKNNQKLGYKNVEFILGEIENMHGVSNSKADVVISNCVMNLVPDKEKAFREVYRVLKTGGHFSISDIVYVGALPNGILEAAELYAGCVAGASEKNAYLGIIKSVGFKNIQIKKERLIELPDELLLKFLGVEGLKEFGKSGSGIYSITVYADKLDEGNCCQITESGCCRDTENSDSVKTECCGTESESGKSCCP